MWPSYTLTDPLGPVTAIIGHGRSPEGKGWGSRIDACSTVIRMWDNQWQTPETHGTKYDIGFYEVAGDLIATVMKHKTRDPSRGWVASFLRRSPTQILPNTELLDQTPWNDIGKSLGGVGKTGRLQFTRGTIVACWAIERSQTGDEVMLVAFDTIRAGISAERDEAFSPEYQRNPGTFSFSGWRGGQTKFGNHDFRVEAPVMQYLADQRGVKLSFAQDVWT